MLRSNCARLALVSRRVSFVLWSSLVGLAAVVCMAPSARAGTSTPQLFFDPNRPGFESPGGSGTATGGGNSWTVVKEFGSLEEITLGVDVQVPGGQPVTIQVDEQIFNNTGIDWTDFHLEVEPIDAPLDLLVNFNNVMVPQGMTFETMDNALWIFGSVPDGEDMLLIYEMEVSSFDGDFALFAVHEHPTIPEPSAMVLVALCAVAGLATPRRRTWARTS